ncbi:MAG: glycosyltransferase family 2 protein [Chloroflexota bacterium]|nr:MAG: glycosyltransferase family 2 protein [Chloroflexota bacterium]
MGHGRPVADRGGRRRRQLVEHVDRALVCHPRRWRAPGSHDRRRPDAHRPRLRRSHRRDPAIPRDPARLCHPGQRPRPRAGARPLHPRAADRRTGRERLSRDRRPGGRLVTAAGAAGQTAAPSTVAAPGTATAAARVPALSYFFPAHNEEANLRGLVDEALATLPTLAEAFEVVIVDDGSRDATPQIADELAAADPRVRAAHHPRNLGYGAALRTGFGAARHELIAFTDGDRQFRVADIGRLTARFAEGGADVVVGYRIKRADPLVRTLYAKAYRLANRIFFGLRVTDVDCACKLFRRDALTGINVESGGAFFSAELLIKLRASGRTVVEVGVPHYPRTAGSPTGAKPQVVFRAMRDFWRLRLRLWAAPRRALSRGEPILGDG